MLYGTLVDNSLISDSVYKNHKLTSNDWMQPIKTWENITSFTWGYDSIGWLGNEGYGYDSACIIGLKNDGRAEVVCSDGRSFSCDISEAKEYITDFPITYEYIFDDLNDSKVVLNDSGTLLISDTNMPILKDIVRVALHASPECAISKNGNVKQYNKSITRKRKLLAFLFSSLAVITIITIVYVVFFTPFVLSENKYQYAKELTSQNDYIEALNVFSEISDYKDTDNLMEQIYDLYNGYYERSDTDLTINFKKTDGEFSELTCTYKEGSFSSTVELKEGISEFEFRDSNNDQGSGTLKLTNTGISILIESESFNMIEASFSFDEKKDQIINTLDKSTLLSWLSGNVTIEKLQKDGYDFKFKEYVHAQFGKIYTSKDYPIEIFVSDNFHPNEPVTVISAPAGILAESHIGNSAEPFLEDGVIYAPYGTFPNSSDFAITNYQDNVSNMTINNDTPVYITTKYLVEYGAWERMLEKIQ